MEVEIEGLSRVRRRRRGFRVGWERRRRRRQRRGWCDRNRGGCGDGCRFCRPFLIDGIAGKRFCNVGIFLRDGLLC